jgi:VWFA-related protein
MMSPSSRVVRNVLLLLMCVGSGALGLRNAHADGELTVAIATVDDSAFPVVTAVFTVDDGGRPVTSIPPAGLTATEGGSQATVVSVVSAPDSQIPLGLLITIDTSGSMEGASIVQSQAAAATLVRSLAPGDSGAVITFSDSVRTAASFTQNRDLLLQTVASLRAEGNTALYDAVGQSAKLAAGSGIGRRAVVLLSDGEDFGGRSTLSRDQALAQAASGGALFYVIGIGAETDRSFLQDVASRSGGKFFEAKSAADIPGIFTSIQAVLRSQFVATIRSTGPAADRSRNLSLTVAIDGRSGTQVRSYETLRPPVARQPTATPEPVVTVSPIPVPVQTPVPSTGEGGSTVFAGVVALAVLVLGAIVLYLWRRRARSAVPLPAPSLPAAPLPAGVSVPRPEAAGRITVMRGPATIEIFDADGGPVTIGTAATCTLQLPAEEGVENEHARLWWRDGSPMVHSLGRDALTLLNGEPVRWASLGDGDQLTVGPFVLRFTRGPSSNGHHPG